MANRLKMAIHDTILQLHGLHWSKRRIGRELGIDRATVAGHLAHGKCQEPLSNTAGPPYRAVPPTGSAAPNAATFGHAPAPGADGAAERSPETTAPDPNAAKLPTGSESGM